VTGSIHSNLKSNIHNAPIIKSRKITAFLQPKTNLTKYKNGTYKPLENYGITLRIGEMYFIPLENPNKPTDLGIKVLLKNYIVHKDTPRLREAVYILIEHLIGEKSFANNIAFIEIEQLVGNQKNTIALCYLHSYIQEKTIKTNKKYRNFFPKTP